ncbi:MAG: hypothetical protein ACPG32_14985, partial [Akkermansiaceae bacterium]
MDGQLSSHTRPDSSLVGYGYNGRQLLKSLTADGPPPVADYTYNGRNQLDTTIIENGLLTRERDYDDGGRLTAIVQKDNAATIIESTSYTHDDAGQRLTANRNGSTTTTTYYLYNGWNVELEHNGTHITNRRSWGLDLSGSIQGAGG